MQKPRRWQRQYKFYKSLPKAHEQLIIIILLCAQTGTLPREVHFLLFPVEQRSLCPRHIDILVSIISIAWSELREQAEAPYTEHLAQTLSTLSVLRSPFSILITHILTHLTLCPRESSSLAPAVSNEPTLEPVNQDPADHGAVSGLSAAHTIYLAGGNVVLLDKNSTESIVVRSVGCCAEMVMQTLWEATPPRRRPASTVP